MIDCKSYNLVWLCWQAGKTSNNDFLMPYSSHLFSAYRHESILETWPITPFSSRPLWYSFIDLSSIFGSMVIDPFGKAWAFYIINLGIFTFLRTWHQGIKAFSFSGRDHAMIWSMPELSLQPVADYKAIESRARNFVCTLNDSRKYYCLMWYFAIIAFLLCLKSRLAQFLYFKRLQTPYSKVSWNAMTCYSRNWISRNC